MKTRLLAYLLLPVAVYARDERPIRDSIPPGAKKSHHHKPVASTVQYGVASFYADKFEGRKTYTDEIFSQEKFTGASNTLPMHTWVRVTNLRNHRTVVVRINDKMHPRNKRLIDLSRAAAARLGYAGRGLTRVRIDVLGKERPPDAEEEMAVRQPGQD
ncbi:MAG TPA: septal ring lytic transglycosylase RlpA family protein [Puia sp.]|uniref:septal ring lytic transglycosylase RlpA family protein n=1 Tax=Puia sp. TaxID=2045100 RepID=UPI002B826735|nr:septal ring lytic transglycosylase RlpA family protein [Puia sp.]HVU95846.1 septal ring lytic transglycosylase RlpA family protein [Puia sp.]